MRILVSLLFVLLTVLVQAQEKRKQFGLGGQVYYSTVFWTKSGEPTDSLNSMDHGVTGINPQLWFMAELDRGQSIQVGLQYSTTGFRRRAANVQYKVQYHPDLPVITDNLQGDPRHIDFFYRSHYIGIPVFYNREIIAFRKSISLHYYFTPGISFGFLVYDKTVARTRGFGFDGKNRFVLNNIYEGNPFNLQLHLGGRLEYWLSSKYRTHFQPVINLPLTSVFRSGDKAYVPSFGINLILTMDPSKEEVKD